MKRINFKVEYIIIVLIVLIKTVLHLIADSNSGFDGDEIYHIEAGKHLALGYMEFPPMIGLFSWIQNLFNSDSIYIHHLFVHIATALIIVFCGLTVIRLGGKWKAVLLCLGCILSATCFGKTQNAFQPVIFDQLFWMLSFYLLISYLKTHKSKYLILLSISLAFGFLTKYSILFFVFSFAISVFIFRIELLREQKFWIAILIFILIISPNIFWQIRNQLPVFAHFSRLYEAHLDKINVFDNLLDLALDVNPFTIIVWLAGMGIIPFISFYKDFRLGLFVILFSFSLMLLANGKPYYFYPIILMSFVTGSVVLENLLLNRKWILIGYTSLILLIAPITALNGLPILPRDQYIKFFDIKKNEAGVTPVMDAYCYGEMWANLNRSISNIYHVLPDSVRKNCLIWGDTYSWASAVNLYSDNYNIPKAFSFHGSYSLWLPEFSKGLNVIAVSNTNNKEDYKNRLEYYKEYFNFVELKEQLFNQYTNDETDYYFDIFLCRDIKYDSKTMTINMRHRIFE
jgi:4-amino-4-deoxy-L-arabinose transferase-like glycosyltransferase